MNSQHIDEGQIVTLKQDGRVRMSDDQIKQAYVAWMVSDTHAILLPVEVRLSFGFEGTLRANLDKASIVSLDDIESYY